jgi:prepilin-type processing-associated H-X9-DG protein
MTPQSPPDDKRATIRGVWSPHDERNGIAVAALVLGIIGLLGLPLLGGLAAAGPPPLALLPCVLGCPLAGVVGGVLGLIGLVRAIALPSRKGLGLAIAGICCSGLYLVPLTRLLWSAAWNLEITRRPVCMSNLRGIGQAMAAYANANMGWYPVAPFAEARPGEDGGMAVSFIGQMGANLTTPLAADHESTVHPSRSLFLLVIDGACTPRQFLCPSSGDLEDDLCNYPGGVAVVAQPGRNRFDFRGYGYMSYGYQLPFGPHARPTHHLDSRVAILADKGPFFGVGRVSTPGFADARAGPKPGTLITLPQFSDAAGLLTAGNEAWEQYNSRNHAGAGQNVLFVDGHVEFAKKPIVGVDNDNIYTQQAGYRLEDVLLGRSPQDKQGPLTETDSLIVP